MAMSSMVSSLAMEDSPEYYQDATRKYESLGNFGDDRGFWWADCLGACSLIGGDSPQELGVAWDDEDDDALTPEEPLARAFQARNFGSCLQSFERSYFFQALVTVALLCSGLGTYCRAERTLLTDTQWNTFDCWLLCFFFFELVLRVVVNGRSFFVSKECSYASRTTYEDLLWNYFDIIIIVACLLYETFKPKRTNKGAGVLVLRMLRLLRVFRAVRILRSVPELYILMRSLAQALRPVGWMCILLFLWILVCATLLTSVIGKKADEFEDPDTIREHFGTVFHSMGTLFIFLTMDNWSETARLVNEQYPWMEVFWFWYLVLGAFTCLSVIIGVMSDEVAKARLKHKETVAGLQEQRFHNLRRRLRRIFRMVDGNADMKVDIHEFKQMLHSDVLQAELLSSGIHGLDPEDADELFVVLFNRQESVCFEEFFDALHPLGMPLAADSHGLPGAIAKEVMKLEGQVLKLSRYLDEHNASTERIDVLHARAEFLRMRSEVCASALRRIFESANFKLSPSLRADSQEDGDF